MFLFSGSCIISNLAFLGTLGQQEEEDYEQQLGSTVPSCWVAADAWTGACPPIVAACFLF